MIKLYIEGFRGDWAWIPTYEMGSKFECVCNASSADVIFQADPTNWRSNEKYLGDKIVIANVLDFAEWVGGNPDIDEYVEKFVKKADKATAISQKVIDQLSERGVNAKMFYYPSQVDQGSIDFVEDMTKRKRLISFCRLADPGKKIEYAVNEFMNSKMPENGWTYSLVGMERPNFKLGNRVNYVGYLDRQTLLMMIASSYYTVMPSIGEGLGLPAIEAGLLGTHSIVRNINPVRTNMGVNSYYFNEENGSLKFMFDLLSESFDMEPHKPIDREILFPWIRENAFASFEDLIEGVVNDN